MVRCTWDRAEDPAAYAGPALGGACSAAGSSAQMRVLKSTKSRFYSRLLQSGRPGFYFRVLEEGEVGPGDTIRRLSEHPVGMTVRQMSNMLYFAKGDMDGARRALRIDAMSPGWRQSFETRLAKATRAGGTALSS